MQAAVSYYRNLGLVKQDYREDGVLVWDVLKKVYALSDWEQKNFEIWFVVDRHDITNVTMFAMVKHIPKFPLIRINHSLGSFSESVKRCFQDFKLYSQGQFTFEEKKYNPKLNHWWLSYLKTLQKVSFSEVKGKERGAL